jgi:hypothetical protein
VQFLWRRTFGYGSEPARPGLGNKVEQNRNTSSYYEIVIDMEGGGQQFITLENPGNITPGARVTVQGQNIALR